MSVVVWDGKTLAADRQATCAGLRYTAQKIKRLADGTLLAWTGQQDTGGIMAAWYEAGADLSRYPETQKEREQWSRLIAVTPNGEVLMFEQYPHAIKILDSRMAWGAGRDWALAALEMGADARRAVEVACQFSTDCGMGVEAFDLRPLELVKTGD